MKRILVISLLLATVVPAVGQNHVKEAMRKAKEREEAMARRIVMDDGRTGLGGYLSYRVMDGDTMYFDTIDPVWILACRSHSHLCQKELSFRFVQKATGWLTG